MNKFLQGAPKALLFSVLVLFAMFCGLVLSLGVPFFSIGLFSFVLLPYLVLVPLDILLVTLLPLVYLVTGQLQYFGKLNQALWLPYVLMGGLMVRIPFEALRAQRAAGSKIKPAGLYPFVIAMLCVFIASAAVNFSQPMFVLVGAKSYLLPFALMTILLIVGRNTRYWSSFWQGIPWLCILQVPLVLYQHFFVAKQRSESLDFTQVSWDAVVGSFGGNQDGGGASGAMALFLVFAVFAVLAMWRSGEIRRRLAVCALGSILISILLAEIKVVFVLLPCAAVYFYRREMIARPMKALGMLALFMVFIAAAFSYYSKTFWSTSDHQISDTKSALDYVFKDEGNLGYINYRTGEVSRLGAPLVWWDENVGRGDMAHAVLGYGPSASRISRTVGMGDAAKRHSFNLTTNTASTVLWDFGIAGAVVLFGLLASSLWRASFSRKLQTLDSIARGRVEAAGAGLLCITVCLLYTQDAIDNAAIQVLWVSLCAYVSIALASTSTGRISVSAQPVARRIAGA